MCGIVGNVLARADRRPDQAILEAMANRLVHRGPDGAGFVVRGAAGLGIRRLNTVDGESAPHPLTGEDGSVWAVADGEVYNHRELASRLAAHGHVFRSRSGTESIVHAWEMRGRDALEDLEGTFALAVWHEPSRTLVLARDRLGVKPLYYALLPDQIVFASELRAMLAHPAISRELDVDALSAYLAHEWVPAPRSMLRAVRKLPAGHRLVYADGQPKIERWWDVRYGGGPSAEIVGVAHLAAALDLSVRQHLAADVPVGLLLSGGIAPAAVAAIAAGHVPGRVRTFTLGVDDPLPDELAAARATAHALGAEHHELVAGSRDVLDLLNGVADLVDEPLGDASILTTHLLSRFARRSVTVALSGDGGDEVFAGAATYRAHELGRLWQLAPASLRSAAGAIIERLPVFHDEPGLRARLERFAAGATMQDTVDRHAFWTGSFAPQEQHVLLTPETLARLPAPLSLPDMHGLAEAASSSSWLEQLMYLDLKARLAEGVLQRVDRASMACSLQLRVPLVDRRVVEVAARLGGRSRHSLERAMRGRVPKAALRRPGKGSDIPLGRWLRGELSALLEDVFEAAALRRTGLFRPEAVRRLLDEHRAGRRDHRRKLYTLLVFLLWSRRHGIGYL